MMVELLNTLFVQTQGAGLRLDHDAVVAVLPDREPVRLPLARIQEIVVFGRISVSNHLIERCAADGRSIVWLSRSGRFVGRLQGPVIGSVLLRRAQHLLFGDEPRRLRLACNLVAGKVTNSRRILLRAARDAMPERAAVLRDTAASMAALLAALPEAPDLDTVRGIEGRSARWYFNGLHRIVTRADLPAFDGRSRRPPRDPFNAALSFAYGLLRQSCWSALETVGLDPQVGYLHGMRPGRPALALDLMEELRPVLADRLVLTLVNRRQLVAESFELLPGGAIRLSDQGRRTLLDEWQRQRERTLHHALLKSDVAAGHLPHVQARLLARHIRNDLATYIPFTIRG